jgi:hypothetical protein
MYINKLENIDGTIKNGQSRETVNIGYTRRRKTKQKSTQYVLDTTIRKQHTYLYNMPSRSIVTQTIDIREG